MTPWTPTQILAFAQRVKGINDRYETVLIRLVRRNKSDGAFIKQLMDGHRKAMIRAHELFDNLPWR